MKTLSLSELKAQNKSEEQEVKPVEDEYIEVDPETEEPIEVENPEEEAGDEVEEDTETDESTEDLEDWQKGEAKDDDSKGKFVPNAEAKKLRLKTKDLKAEAKEKDTELEDLRAQVESLSQPKPEVKSELPPRPKAEDYDYDDDKHSKALDDWYDLKFDRKMDNHTSNLQQKREQESQLQTQNQQREQAVSAHLNKAADLINSKKITEDNWLAGDKLIRQTLDLALPGKGNDVADQFIALMESNGDGSEKAWYYIGRNPAALTALRDKVLSDNTGASALMYLAGIQKKASQSIKKKRSDAPSPADKLKGDVITGSAKSIKKDYDKAGKTGDLQSRITLKRKAKKAGVDVSQW